MTWLESLEVSTAGEIIKSCAKTPEHLIAKRRQIIKDKKVINCQKKVNCKNADENCIAKHTIFSETDDDTDAEIECITENK